MDDTYKVTLQTCIEARALGSGFLSDGVVGTTDGYSSVKVYEWQYAGYRYLSLVTLQVPVPCHSYAVARLNS